MGQTIERLKQEKAEYEAVFIQHGREHGRELGSEMAYEELLKFRSFTQSDDLNALPGAARDSWHECKALLKDMGFDDGIEEAFAELADDDRGLTEGGRDAHLWGVFQGIALFYQYAEEQM